MIGEFIEASAISLSFDVPDDWDTPVLDDCCEFIRDGDWIELKDQGGADYRLLQISNIGLGEFRETGNYRWITEETFQRLRCTEIREGDVLVARMPEPTGRAWYVKDLPWPSITAVDVAIIRPIPDRLNARYLSYFLNSKLCLSVVDSLTTGTTRRRIRRADIQRLRVPRPPLPEQQAIAHILGTLDDKIELNRRMNQTLEEMARAIFKSWFVDFDPVRAKAAGQQPPGLAPHIADLFPDVFEDSELGEIPKGWGVGTVGEDFDITMGQSPPGKTYNEDGDGLPFYQGRRDFGFRYPSLRVYCSAPTRFAKPGDTLVSVRAPVGDINMAIEDCCVGRGVAAVRHRSGSRSYTYYAMKSLRTLFDRFEAEGTVFGSLNKRDFHNLPFLIPPAQVVREFERRVFPIDQLVETSEQQVQTLAVLRDTLLPKLMSGELRVPEAESFVARAV